MKIYILLGAVMLGAAITFSEPVKADALESLERERAIILTELMSPSTSLLDRQGLVDDAKHRLIDLERIVLRDTSLKGKNIPDVQRAFSNYDLTFLFHASAEHNRLILDHWLNQVGINTKILMATRMGRR